MKLFKFLSDSKFCLGTLFIIFFVPETKGKTTEEIKEFFQKSIKDDDCDAIAIAGRGSSDSSDATMKI